jgi:hypothetical protein
MQREVEHVQRGRGDAVKTSARAGAMKGRAGASASSRPADLARAGGSSACLPFLRRFGCHPVHTTYR